MLLTMLAAEALISASPSEFENAKEPPVIPVGLDAYKMWDRWAYLRIGQRAYMTCTYDRSGGNETADASHFLYQIDDEHNVSMDVMGPGILEFARYNHWHGSPWHYIVDGNDYVLKETSTADPNSPVPDSVFIPEKQFPNPLTWTWSHTKGADLMWVPIPFEKSFTMAYGRTHYGTGYYIYHKFVPGIKNLSREIKSWTTNDIPPQEVLDLLKRSGEDIAPKDITEVSGIEKLEPGITKLLVKIEKAPSTIRAIKFTVPKDQADAFSKAFLRITWDDARHPSVDAPVGLFFGAGSLYNRENREYLVKAFPVNIRFSEDSVHFSMYFPMPFMRSAKIELIETEGKNVDGIKWSVRYEPYNDPANWVGNFHATYKDHGEPEPGKDLPIPEQAWSEYRYTAYCFVMPEV